MSLPNSLLFSPFSLASPAGGVPLANRIVIAPMCQYQAVDGCATDWHLMHWGNLLNSGAGLLTIEATAVLPEGRITPGCLGLWDDHTALRLGQALGRARKLAPPMPVCIQLAHAGRKGSSAVPWQGGMLLSAEQGGWRPFGPSALAHLPSEEPPLALDEAGIAHVRQAFVDAARRAAALGLDAIELHAAHGYLLHQFLSPLANQRTDAYGGNLENRMRLVLEIFEGCRAVFQGALGVRVSATDWVEGGWTPEDTCALGQQLKSRRCDFIHVSTGGVSPLQKIAPGPGYQLPFAQQVRTATALTTMGVGMITEPRQAEAALQDGSADLVALARAFLYQPRWGWQAAAALGATVQANPVYWRCLPREAQAVFGKTSIGMR